MNMWSSYEFKYVALLTVFFCAMIVRCIFLGFYSYPKEIKKLEGANRFGEAKNTRLLMQKYRGAYLWQFIGLAIFGVLILFAIHLLESLKQVP